jgi:hypothetical protein
MSHTCMYCKKQCTRAQSNWKGTWYDCSGCSLMYELSSQSNTIITMRFDCMLGKEIYRLYLNFKDQITTMERFGKRGNPTVLSLDFVMTGVTPSNVTDKVKTMIVFS